MKRILTAIALIACLVLPLSAMAMSTIADNELSTVTGQAGVSIGADLTTDLTFGTIAWGDSNGIGGTTTAGWVGLKDGAIDNLRLHMRSDQGMADVAVAYSYYSTLIGGTTYADIAAFGAAVAGGAGSTDVEVAKSLLLSILATNQLLTIDVYSNTASTKTYVRIGLPTFEVKMASMVAKAGLWTDNAGVPGTFQEMGAIYMSNMVGLLGKNNYVDISVSDTTTSGIHIAFGNTGTGNLMDSLTLDAVSWGDSDGLSGLAANAGYIGLTGVNIKGIKANATLDINVGTASGAGVADLLALDLAGLAAYQAALPGLLDSADVATKDTLAYMMHQAGIIGTTSVNIALTGGVTIGSLTATVALGSTNTLANAAADQNVLGSLYISNVVVNIPAYAAGVTPASWVSISAH